MTTTIQQIGHKLAKLLATMRKIKLQSTTHHDRL